MLYGSLLFVYEVMKDERRIVTMIKCSFVTWNNKDMVLTVTMCLA